MEAGCPLLVFSSRGRGVFLLTVALEFWMPPLTVCTDVPLVAIHSLLAVFVFGIEIPTDGAPSGFRGSTLQMFSFSHWWGNQA